MAAEKRDVAFLTDAELADIEQRIAAGNRLRALIRPEPPEPSELERLVAEVRYWRSHPAVVAGLERAADIARAESDEYLRNAKACDASGNTFGGTMDTNGAASCRRVEARIREMITQAKRTL